MSHIAANIKALRKEKGLSQEQFAQMLHVTRQTVSAWERGLSRPGLETLAQIARELGVEPEQLLYGPEGGRKKPDYKSVSFWPVVWVIPVFYAAVCWIFPILFGGLIGTSDTAFVLMAQLFVCVLVMVCYCSLKDEIRNRDYYDKTEEDSDTTQETKQG